MNALRTPYSRTLALSRFPPFPRQFSAHHHPPQAPAFVRCTCKKQPPRENNRLRPNFAALPPHPGVRHTRRQARLPRREETSPSWNVDSSHSLFAWRWSGRAFSLYNSIWHPNSPPQAPEDKIAQVDEKAPPAAKNEPAPAADPKTPAASPEDPAQAGRSRRPGVRPRSSPPMAHARFRRPCQRLFGPLLFRQPRRVRSKVSS